MHSFLQTSEKILKKKILHLLTFTAVIYLWRRPFFFYSGKKKCHLYNWGLFYYSHHANHSLTQPNYAERMRKTQKPEELILLFAPDTVCRPAICLEELPARFVLQRKQNYTSQTEGYLNPIRPDTKQNGSSTVGSFTVKHRPSDVSWSLTRAKNNIFLTPLYSPH